MGLRCLLGHEYANREVEREREERGDEVVVTYRTVETCERCGERRIVSENKEVRPVRDPSEEGVTTGLGGGVTPDLDADDAEAGPDAETPTDAETPATGGEPADDVAAADPDPDPTAEAAADPESAEAETDPSPSADEDDAIILDDDDGPSADRNPGQWPGADDADDDAAEPAAVPEADDGTTVVEGEGWPDPEGEDEGFDAAPGDAAPEDAAIDEEVGPAVGDAAATNGTTEATGGATAGKQFVAAQEVEPVGDDRTTAAETEFFCPNCGHARGAGGSSMRAGDICPECHQGYIAERER